MRTGTNEKFQKKKKKLKKVKKARNEGKETEEILSSRNKIMKVSFM